MMARYSDWTSPEIDTRTPSAARLYDYYLGGAHHFEADRELGRQILAALPDMRYMAQRTRMFARRRRLRPAGHRLRAGGGAAGEPGQPGDLRGQRAGRGRARRVDAGRRAR